MSNSPNAITNADDRVTKGVTSIGQAINNKLGPQESEAEKPTPAPAPPEIALKNLLLPTDLYQILKPPLEKLGFSLEESKTANDLIEEMTDHHVIETSGGKIVLLYVAPEVLKSNRSDISSLGFVFIEDPKIRVFIFSRAEDMEKHYDPVITTWRRKVFKKVAIFLQKDIVRFEKMAEDYLQNFLKEEFGLPDVVEEKDSGEPVAYDHQKLFSQMKGNFDHNELSSLSFALDPEVSYDDFRGPGGTEETAIIELIKYFKRRNLLRDLLNSARLSGQALIGMYFQRPDSLL